MAPLLISYQKNTLHLKEHQQADEQGPKTVKNMGPDSIMHSIFI